MKRMVIVALACGILCAGSLAALAAGPKTVVLPARMGDVTFPHAAHQKMVDDCKTCHHMSLAKPKCTNCHGDKKGDAPKAKDVFHKLCKSCHKESGGPTGCKGCHQK